MKDCVAHVRFEFQLDATADRYQRAFCVAIVGTRRRAARYMRPRTAQRLSSIGLDCSNARTFADENSTVRSIAVRSRAINNALNLLTVHGRLISSLIALVAKPHFGRCQIKCDRPAKTRFQTVRNLAERFSDAAMNVNSSVIKANVDHVCKKWRLRVDVDARSHRRSVIKEPKSGHNACESAVFP